MHQHWPKKILIRQLRKWFWSKVESVEKSRKSIIADAEIVSAGRGLKGMIEELATVTWRSNRMF
jgi:hypothetical protein